MRAEYGHGLFGVPDDDEHPLFQWFHVRPGDSEMIILGSKAPLWYKAHWVEGRMQPCPGEGCRWCSQGIGKQRRWVFAMVIRGRRQPMLWEVGEGVAAEIRDVAEQHGQVTGLVFQVKREAGGNKGRIKMHSFGLDTLDSCSGLVFPEPQEALELTWTALNLRSEFRSEEPLGSGR